MGEKGGYSNTKSLNSSSRKLKNSAGRAND
jgi:hypothetical protein